MVLESLVSPSQAEREPWELYFIGLVYASIAIFLSLWIFRDQSSLIMVFLTVLAAVPLMYRTLRLEEKKDVRFKDKNEVFLLKSHSRALAFFTFLFFGIMTAFFVWYVFLPAPIVELLFSTQIQTIDAINAQIHGLPSSAGRISASLAGGSLLLQILANNIKVLLFCIFFSFFYGAGAIFILTWNASVIAAAIGSFIRNNLSEVFGLTYFSIFTIGIFKYMTHGFFEIVAYFMGGLAGGIISVAVIRHDMNTEAFRKVLYDSIDLILLATAIVIIGGIIEVYVTPALF